MSEKTVHEYPMVL